jgi:amino acid transporter
VQVETCPRDYGLLRVQVETFPRDSIMAAMDGLRRQLGTRDLVLKNVAAILSPRWMAFAAASGPSSVGLWVAASIFFFVPNALCITALSSSLPQEGGLYSWSKRA